jgi:hypothetical protein
VTRAPSIYGCRDSRGYFDVANNDSASVVGDVEAQSVTLSKKHTLNRLKARCIGGPVAVMIKAPEVEVIITSITKAGPNIMVPPPGAIYTVLALLLKRYAP